MNRFEKTYKRTEKVMLSRNTMLFSFLLLKLRYLNIDPDIDSIIVNYSTYSESDKSILRRELFSKINIGFLYRELLFLSSNMLYNKDYYTLETTFESYKELGLITSSKITKDKDEFIEITIPDGDVISYSPMGFLASSEIDILRGNCHEISSCLIRRKENKNCDLAVVLEPNLFGGQSYHSFIVSDGIIVDFAHNLAIKYEDYIKLVNPDVLVRENCQNVVNEIVDLNIMDSTFYSCDFVDVLKYGIEKQLRRGKAPVKKYPPRKCNYYE